MNKETKVLSKDNRCDVLSIEDYKDYEDYNDEDAEEQDDEENISIEKNDTK